MMQFDESIPRNLTQPGIKGQGSIAQEVGQFLVRIGERVLHDIRGVDPGGEPPVKMNRNHLPKPVPVSLQKLLECVTLAASGFLDQLLRLAISIR